MSLLHINQLLSLLSGAISPMHWSSRTRPVRLYEKFPLRLELLCIEGTKKKVGPLLNNMQNSVTSIVAKPLMGSREQRSWSLLLVADWQIRLEGFFYSQWPDRGEVFLMWLGLKRKNRSFSQNGRLVPKWNQSTSQQLFLPIVVMCFMCYNIC